MPTLNLHSDDIASLLDGLSEIQELSALDLSESPELHYALANIIGDIRDQCSAGRSAPDLRFRKRVELESLLVEKFAQWESERKNSGGHRDSAASILSFHLENSGRDASYFDAGTNANSAIASFRMALDDSRSWTRCEVQLCASTKAEIDALTLGDIAHSLSLAG